MGNKTKNILIASISLAFFSIGLCSYMIYEIDVKGLQLEEQVKILAENNSKEELYLNIRRTIQETEADRNSINNKFFKSEDDSIDFLSEIESLAPTLGLVLSTKALEPVLGEDKKPQSLKMSFVYSGNKEAVLGFTKMLGNLQYHSYLESLTLKKSTGNNWEGNVTLLISIDPS